MRKTAGGDYVYMYDANGNVGQLVDAAGGALAAHYEYDPFGNTLVASGSEAGSNPFRFSTKYFDTETGLYYYGYRYYSPELGRWISRDPIGEQGAILFLGQSSIHLDDELQDYFDNRWTESEYEEQAYHFVTNDPIDTIDLLGLQNAQRRISGQRGVPHRSLKRHHSYLEFRIACPACRIVHDVKAHYDLVARCVANKKYPKPKDLQKKEDFITKWYVAISASQPREVINANCDGASVIVQAWMRTRFGGTWPWGREKYVDCYQTYMYLSYDCHPCEQ